MHLAYGRERALGAALVLWLVLLALVVPSFFQLQPLVSLATREAPVLIIACGMALIIIGKQIDISVGSQFAVCTVSAGLLASAGLPWPLVFLIVLLLGGVLGAINGFLVAFLRLPSIVVTLATLVIWREVVRWQRQGAFINLPEDWQWFGLSQLPGQGAILVVALLLCAVLAWSAGRITAARWVYAVGSDEEAARLAGIPPRAVILGNFVLLGLLVGLAAMLNLAQSPQADPKSGTGLEMKVIAAVVVGGVAITGGRGRLWGVMLGFALLVSINPALTHLKIEAHWEKAIHGLIILLAVALSARSSTGPR